MSPVGRLLLSWCKHLPLGSDGAAPGPAPAPGRPLCASLPLVPIRPLWHLYPHPIPAHARLLPPGPLPTPLLTSASLSADSLVPVSPSGPQAAPGDARSPRVWAAPAGPPAQLGSPSVAAMAMPASGRPGSCSASSQTPSGAASSHVSSYSRSSPGGDAHPTPNLMFILTIDASVKASHPLP